MNDLQEQKIEIANVAKDLLSKGKNLEASLITDEIMHLHKHEFVSTNTSKWAELNIRANINREVCKFISKNATNDITENDGQLTFQYEGYDCVQQFYLFDGVGVFVENMTRKQFHMKRRRYAKMRGKLSRHEDQLLDVEIKIHGVATPEELESLKKELSNEQ